MEHTLVFKWGVSRGRATYGYSICSLYVNGKKVAMCNGGGYDMQGTVFGNWIASKFKDELLKLEIPMIDGACGFSSVKTIIEALGYKLEYIHNNSKESIYVLKPIDS